MKISHDHNNDSLSTKQNQNQGGLVNQDMIEIELVTYANHMEHQQGWSVKN